MYMRSISYIIHRYHLLLSSIVNYFIKLVRNQICDFTFKHLNTSSSSLAFILDRSK